MFKLSTLATSIQNIFIGQNVQMRLTPPQAVVSPSKQAKRYIAQIIEFTTQGQLDYDAWELFRRFEKEFRYADKEVRKKWAGEIEAAIRFKEEQLIGRRVD